MKRQITTYNSHGQPLVLELGETDTLMYDNLHNPFVLPQDHSYSIDREGRATVFPTNMK